jgi:ElaB/YqjD/DUF883 family membrane-anchored ribosome-binding protein
VADAADTATEKVAEVTGQAKDRAYDAAEAGRESTADALGRGAAALKERATEGEGLPAAVADRAADGLESAAGYLKEHETSEVWQDLERYVRAHPMQSVAAAIAAGIVFGRALR